MSCLGGEYEVQCEFFSFEDNFFMFAGVKISQEFYESIRSFSRAPHDKKCDKADFSVKVYLFHWGETCSKQELST